MKYCELGEVATIDRTIATEEECERLPYVGLEHIEKGTGWFTNEHTAEPEELLAAKFRFTSHHILYGKLRPYLNKVAVPTFDGVCSTEILPILPDPTQLDRFYLWGALLHPDFVHWASNIVSGANLPRLSPSDLARYRIPLPPLPEQRRIATILRAADEERRRRRATQALSDGLLGEVFVQMFGDPATNPMGWKTQTLIHFIQPGSKINYGVVQPGDDYAGGVPIVRVGDFDDLGWTTDHLKRIDPAIEVQYKQSRLRGDEILVACVGSIGKVALATERLKGFNIVRAVARIPSGEAIDKAYLVQYLRLDAAQAYFRDETRTVSQPTLNIEQIEQLPIQVPPMERQRKFSAIVAEHEQTRRQQQESARQSDHLFETLLHRAFAGEL